MKKSIVSYLLALAIILVGALTFVVNGGNVQGLMRGFDFSVTGTGKNKPLPLSIKCKDTDNGIDYKKKGSASGKKDDTKIVGDYEDSCGVSQGEKGLEKGKWLAETYCNAQDNYVHTEWYECPGICKEGKCKSYDVVDIVPGENRDYAIDFYTILRNENGLKYYFSENGPDWLDCDVFVYYQREFNGSQYWGGMYCLIGFVRDMYSNEKLTNNYSDEGLSIRVESSCTTNSDYCSVLNPTKSYHQFENEDLVFLIDKSLMSYDYAQEFVTEQFPLMGEAIDYLKSNIGNLPQEKVVLVYNVDNVDASSAAVYMIGGAIIMNRIVGIPVDENNPANELGGNPYRDPFTVHELLHVYLRDINVASASLSWFEEGLANYYESMYFVEVGLPSPAPVCLSNGWKSSNSDTAEIMPYMDFNQIDPSYPRSYYYQSAECFWIYVRDNFGHDTINDITMKIAKIKQSKNFKEFTVKRLFINDIVNPTVGSDLSELVKNRYNYVD